MEEEVPFEAQQVLQELYSLDAVVQGVQAGNWERWGNCTQLSMPCLLFLDAEVSRAFQQKAFSESHLCGYRQNGCGVLPHQGTVVFCCKKSIAGLCRLCCI